MRHILVHDYFKVNWDRVYETAHVGLPALKPQIEAILAALPPDDDSLPCVASPALDAAQHLGWIGILQRLEGQR